MRLYRSDAGWQEREKDIRADAVIVSMSPTKLSLGAVASLQSPLPFQPSKIIVPRIVIGGVILDQPAGGEIGAVGVGFLAGTEYHEPESLGTWVRWCLDRIRMYGPKGFSRVWGLSLNRQLTGELGGERAHV